MLESGEKMWYNNYIFAKRGMKMNICDLKPKKVFEYFALLSSVPHGSGNMKPIADICENFAKGKGFEYIRDAADNIIINGKFVTKSDGLPVFGKEVWGVGHVNLIKNWYDCLERGEKFSIDFYEARKVIKLVLAMYRSNGKEIKI